MRLSFLLSLLSLLALVFAFAVQLGWFGLTQHPPCELCWYQRVPHMMIAILAIPVLLFKNPFFTFYLICAGISLLVSGYHFGIEQGWIAGFTECTSNITKGDITQNILNAPIVRCDQATAIYFGMSMAFWNLLYSAAIIALLTAIVVFNVKHDTLFLLSEQD